MENFIFGVVYLDKNGNYCRLKKVRVLFEGDRKGKKSA